jgi:hypothetical protein
MDAPVPTTGQYFSQLVWLFTLALPVATVAWTVTHEEIIREAREYFTAQTHRGPVLRRKFFYALTCEYCFSHYVTAVFLWLTKYKLLLDDWRGYLIAFFAVTAIANVYMSLFGRVRVDIKSERLDIAVKEEELGEKEIRSP